MSRLCHIGVGQQDQTLYLVDHLVSRESNLEALFASCLPLPPLWPLLYQYLTCRLKNLPYVNVFFLTVKNYQVTPKIL